MTATPALPASAAPPEPAVETVVMAVAAWVAQEMDVPLPAELPRVAFASAGEMAALRDSGPQPVLEVVALYRDSTRTLLLPRGWTGASAAELSILVHEMVHFFQATAGRTFACPAERETDAYAAQEAWLRQFGTSLEAEFGINRLTRFVVTSCG